MLKSVLKNLFLKRSPLRLNQQPVFSAFTYIRPAPTSRQLHIGGIEPADGWEIFNSAAFSGVDHIGNAVDLSRFDDNTFTTLYASHVLEHIDYKEALNVALHEWFRVLEPEGTLMIAVPDLEALSRLFISDQLSLNERFQVMRMIFGGHIDAFDYHQVGFDFDILSNFLCAAGFDRVSRVSSFGIFHDCSEIVYQSTAISLNIVAKKSNH